MLVQAQVVPWWGGGDRQSSVPADSTPSRASATGRRIGGYDLHTESFQRPRAEQHTHFREIRNSNFFGAPPLGVGVFGKLPAARKRKDRQRNRLARSQRLRLSREPKARWRPGSARVQARRVPADPTADRKPKACQLPSSLDPTCPENRLGRSQPAPACPRNRKP